MTPTGGGITPTTPASITVTATPGSLGAGTYSGTIVLASADTGESIAVPVTMAISGSLTKVLLSQAGLAFTAVAQAGAPPTQSFGILNTGQGSMAWSAQASTLSGGNWLTVDQSSGTVSVPLTDVSPVNVGVDPTGLQAGSYYGKITVSVAGADNSPQIVSGSY